MQQASLTRVAGEGHWLKKKLAFIAADRINKQLCILLKDPLLRALGGLELKMVPGRCKDRIHYDEEKKILWFSPVRIIFSKKKKVKILLTVLIAQLITIKIIGDLLKGRESKPGPGGIKIPKPRTISSCGPRFS